MASLVPTSRLSSVDLPAFGRPISETKPAFMSNAQRSSLELSATPEVEARELPGGPSQRLLTGVLSHFGLDHSDLVDPPALGVDHFDAETVDLEPLADR